MIFVLLILVGILGYVYLKYTFNYWKRRNVPGPEPTLVVGNIGPNFFKEKAMGEIFTAIYREYEGYPFVGVYRAWTPCLIVRDPEFIRDVTIKNFKCFEDNEISISKHANPLIGRNPFVLKGAEWKSSRSHLAPSFTSGKMKSFYPIIDEASRKLVADINKQIDKNKETLDCKPEMGKFTLDNVVRCSVGLDSKAFDDEDSDFKMISRNFITPGFIEFNTSFIFVFPKLFKFFNIEVFSKEMDLKTRSIVEEVLQHRKEHKIERKDFLHYLDQVRSKDPSFSVTDIAAGISSVFMDGHDTTAGVMSYILFELSLHEEIQARVRQEIEDTLEKYDGIISYDALQEMIFLEACIMECLRLYPIFLSLGKTCVEKYTYTTSDTSDFKKMSVTLEPGTAIIIPYQGFNRDPKYFRNPDDFIPDRFLNEEKNDLPRYVFMPFGEGPRSCLGKRFGLLQAKTGVAYLVQNFKLSLSEDNDNPLRIAPWHFVLSPKRDIRVKFEKILCNNL